MKYILTAILMGALMSACSTQKPEDPGKASPPISPKIVDSGEKGIGFDAKQLANEMESNYVTEIRFKKGSSELTRTAKNLLKGTIARAKKDASMKTAKLITWADQEMPSEKKEELSDEQIDLVKRRNEALSEFIRNSVSKIDIDPISMAQRPEGLKKLVPNETARIQESLEEAGVPEAGEKKEGMGKAGRSIIIFTRE
jgi:hypothetical protein